MPAIQDWIHRIEEGGGLRYLKHALVALALFGMVGSYNAREFKNMSNPEAMDAAQVARNLAEHQGFTTLVIRPFSLYLLQRAAAEKYGPAPLGDLGDRGQIRKMHPDLANAPLYPIVLAGLMKIAPCEYQAAGSSPRWNNSGAFWMYEPDFVISLFNQALFLAATLALFFLARRLFDSRVAWLSGILFLGTDLFWRFSISGLSTMLVILIFLGVVWCLTLLETGARERNWSPRALAGLTAGLGILMGLGALTRYAFGWVLPPVLLFLVLFLRRDRVILCLTVLATFALVFGPWVLRNYRVSRTPFGTAGYALYETTPQFTEFHLERSLHPDFKRVRYDDLRLKLVENIRRILENDLPKLGGIWVAPLFFAGLLAGARTPAGSRVRWFLIFCLPVLTAAQALGRTQLSEESPVINSENLLILLAPVMMIYGASFFYTLLDQLNLPLKQLSFLVTSGFCALACLPMLLTFFLPRVNAVNYPPYYPPVIQKICGWMDKDELMMSDIPCAVAWYGQRQCLWLTLNAQEDFFAIFDYQKPIRAVYLTPETMDSRFLSQWVRAGEHSWGSFIVESMLKQELPPYFPLRKSPGGFLPEQLFLTDRERWTVER